MAAYGTIMWTDGKVRVPVRVEGANTQAKLETLAGAMKTYSNAVWNGVSVFYTNASPGTPETDNFQSAKIKALITFRATNNDIVKLSLPAPKESVFTELTGTPETTPVVNTALATALSTATGKTLTALKGRLVSKPGRK